MKFLFTFLSIILIPVLSYAQISIEERVEINPADQEVMSDDPTSSHAIQLDVQWDTPQYNASIVGAVVPCQSAYTDWQNGGIISLSISDARAGLYRLQPRFNTPSGVLTHVTYQLFFDGIEVLSGERDVPGGYSGSFPYFNIDYTPPLASNYNLSLENNVSCILTPTAISISTFNDCSTGISWNKNTQSVNLTLTSGGEFVSFYDADQQIIGDNFSGTFSVLQSTNIIQDSVYGDSEDKYFIVQCEWGGIVKTDSVRLLTQIGDVIVANTSGEDSLYTGQEVSVELYANDFGGACTIFFPFEATYNAEIIEGNEYGNLVEPNTDEHVQSFTELYHYFSYAYFDYVADGISADSVSKVVIRIGASISTIPSTYLTLYIKPPPIFVYTVPDVVGADDTADVIIKHRLEDGTLEDFPPEQTFELAVLDGCVNGNFMVEDSINVYFEDALQPVKFVTADSLDEEYDKVLIRVGTDLSGLTRPLGHIKGEEEVILEKRSGLGGNTGFRRDTLRAGFEKVIAEKKAEVEAERNKIGEEPPIEVPIVTACALDDPNDLNYWQGNANLGDKPELTIIRDKPLPYINDVYITEEPTMPEVLVKAKLNNYNKGLVKFRWAYWVTSNFPRRNKDSEGNYYNLCHRISQSVFLGYSYTYNQDTTRWTVPFVRDSGYYYFKAIWYKGSTDDHPAYGCNNFYREYEGGNEVFTGGEVSVKVIAYDSEGREIDSDSIWVGKLLGQNENDVQVIYDYATENEIIAIIQHESRTEQFETTNNFYPMYEAGWPKYGYPNGYGLMQIDNTPSAVEEKLWNWKSNIDGGKSRFTTAKSEVQEYIDENNATYVDSIFYMNAYQNYNSGIRRYWDWDKRKEIWKESENKGNNPEYGRNVYNLLKQLNQ